MRGKVVVITGGTSGIGQIAAERLAAVGARMVLVARDRARADAALARLNAAGPAANHTSHLADLSSIAATKAVAAEIAAAEPRIDVLINNAGALFNRRQLSPDGLEMTFAVNHMAYFVLTEGLRERLAATPMARVVSTASAAHQGAKLDLDDLQSAKAYSGFGAYGLSKLCNILWTRELARRLEGSGVTATCFHPGGVNTNFAGDARGLIGAVMSLGKRFMLTPAQGADTLIYLASSPEVAGKTGGYWTKRRLIQPSAAARDPLAARRLWEVSARLSGLPAE